MQGMIQMHSERKEGREGGRRDLAANLTSSQLQHHPSFLPSFLASSASANSTGSLCPKCIVLSLASERREWIWGSQEVREKRKKESLFTGLSSDRGVAHRRPRQGQTGARRLSRQQQSVRASVPKMHRHRTWYVTHQET